MSTVPFSFSRSEDGTETIVILGSEGVRVVSSQHPNYSDIRDALLGGDADEDSVYELSDASARVESVLRRLSDRVTLRRDTIYFDGDAMESRLTRHIVDMIRGGDDNYGGYVAFLENVQANPSKASRKSLFKFLDKHDLLITEDGHFVGYKAVQPDGRSKTAGTEEVTVTLEDGTVDTVVGYVPNPVGATVEMARSLVDPDRGAACSVGLHVGNYRYANWFGGGSDRFLTVKVNPRDVVSVPSDSNDEKIRTCRYTVLELNQSRAQYAGTSFVPGEEQQYRNEDQEPRQGCVCCGDESELDENDHCENCRSCG